MADRRTTYLLPCLCGRDILIEPRQAGETVSCECGRTCVVPTMREIQGLRPAPVPGTMPATAKPAWGNPQRLLLAGLVVVLLAAIAAVILARQIAPRFAGLPPPEAERQYVKGLSTLETIRYFRLQILPGIEISERAAAQSKRNMVYFGMGALGGMGAIGLILAGIGVAGLVRRR